MKHTRWFYSALVLALSLSLTSTVVPQLHADDYTEARHKVVVALSSQQYSQALDLLPPLLKAHPRDSSLWTLRGLALAGLGKTSESLQSFDEALSIDARFSPALQGALQTAYNKGDARATQYAERLLLLEPKNEVANAIAGVLAYQARDCDRALLYFERSAKQIYSNETTPAEYADCLIKKEWTPQAVEVLRGAAHLHPDSVRLAYNLAVALMKNHEPDQVIQLLEPLADKKDSGLLNLLASAYTQANRPDDALHALEAAIELSPQDESNYLDLAILCLEHHQEKRAVVAATAGLSRIPKGASLLLIRGVANAELADYEKAESDFAMAAEVDPDQPHSTIAMSLLYSDRNQLDKEKALLYKQLKATPDDAVTNYVLADLLVRMGAVPGQKEFEEAQRYLGRSLRTNPDSAEAQVLMGKLCEQNGQPDEALLHFQSARRIEPENRSALDHEFLLLRRLHRNQEAAQVAERLKSLINKSLARDNGLFQPPIPTPVQSPVQSSTQSPRDTP